MSTPADKIYYYFPVSEQALFSEGNVRSDPLNSLSSERRLKSLSHLLLKIYRHASLVPQTGYLYHLNTRNARALLSLEFKLINDVCNINACKTNVTEWKWDTYELVIVII